ncbi:MAG: NAD+ synthase [Candidatus Hadarchaeales archaeon]
MERINEILRIKPDQVEGKIVKFIKKCFESTGASCAVVGMSGGVDSTVVSYLTARSIGGDRVVGLSLPENGVTDPHDVADARDVANSLGIRFRTIEISPVIECMKRSIPDRSPEKALPVINLKPRIRMSILYYYSNLLNGLVVGCGNRSEIRAGYLTKFGDGGADLLPIACLYKTQVLQLAEHIGVPRHIIGKKPTAGLWKGQTDEEELGISYEKLDRIYAGLDLGLKPLTIARCAGVDIAVVKNVINREKTTRHKLMPPQVPKL